MTTTTNAGSGPRSLALGDYNGDGVLDLAVAGDNGNDPRIYRGLNNGNFAFLTLTAL